MSERKQVAVIFGGVSPEHDVSILSGVQAFYAIDQSKYEPHAVYIDVHGDWWCGEHLIFEHEKLLFGDFRSKVAKVTLGVKGLYVGDRLHQSIDVCLIALHGGGGENGSVQGLCELYQMPYTGLRRSGASIAMDKWVSKYLFKSHGIHVLPGHYLERPSVGQFYTLEYLRKLHLSFPVCIKPCSLGSSVGVGFANDYETIQALLMDLFEYDNAVVIEPQVQSLKEFNVSVMRSSDNEIKVSAIESPKVDCWLDFNEKYCQGGQSKKNSPEGLINLSREINPEMPKKMKAQLMSAARLAYQVLGGYGVPRIDFLANMTTNEIWLNEVNTTPGSFSYYLWSAQSQKTGYVWLLNHLLTEALTVRGQRLAVDPVPKAARIFKRNEQ